MESNLDDKKLSELITSVSTQFTFQGISMAVTFGNSKNVFPSNNLLKPLPPIDKSKLKRGILPWGNNNRLPEDVVRRVSESEIVGKALEYLVDVAYGDGIMPCHTEIGPDGNKIYKPVELQDNAKEFFELSNPNQYLKSSLTNLFYFHRAYAEIGLDSAPNSRKAVLLTCKDTTYSRLEQANDNGDLENFCYYGSWGWNTPKAEEVVIVPLLSLDLPTRDLLTRTGRLANTSGKKRDLKDNRYIYPLTILKPGKREYPQPAWWAIFKSGWYDFMQAIPQFKKALMKNQMMVKYIIYLEEDYFKNIFREENIVESEAQKGRITKELTELNNFLTNTENTGKSVLGKIRYNPIRGDKPIKSIEIEVLPNNFKGGEYLEDSQEVSKVIATSMGVNLNMIGDIPGKSGSLSGSDVRERFIILNAQMKGIRDLVLEPFYAIKKLNGWDEKLEFTIPNIRLTTTDKNTGATKDVGGPPM